MKYQELFSEENISEKFVKVYELINLYILILFPTYIITTFLNVL